jgi:hypothetical protein
LLQLSDALDISPVALLDGIKWTPRPHPEKPVGEFKITDG